jgi:hypothetical protein
MSWFKRLFGRAKESVENIMANAEERFAIAIDGINEVMADTDNNGLPDIAERLARHAATIVGAIDILNPNSRGAEKLTKAREAVLGASQRGLVIWNILHPLIESAVQIRNLKGAK